MTVRTLHHYDEIDLLHPTGRSEAGYRRYTEDDLEEAATDPLLSRVEFGLDQIKDAMADGGDAIVHLRRSTGCCRSGSSGSGASPMPSLCHGGTADEDQADCGRAT